MATITTPPTQYLSTASTEPTDHTRMRIFPGTGTRKQTTDLQTVHRQQESAAALADVKIGAD